MEDNKREIWGSTLTLWYGRILKRISSYYNRRGKKLIAKGSKTIVANPKCRFVNAHTMVFNFTINNTEKFQLVIEGNFVAKFKSWRKVLDEYAVKVEEFNELKLVYDNLEDKKGAVAPVAVPPISESPLSTKEMFMVILPAHKRWFKKEQV